MSNYKILLFLMLLGLGQIYAQPKNFIIIFTDDQGYEDLSCFGSNQISRAEGVKYKYSERPGGRSWPV
jgi:hypothetical protein